MNGNKTYRDITQALPSLSTYVLSGDEVGSRLGERVLERTAVGVTLTNPMDREILLQQRKANLVAQIAETAWVLRGRDDLKFLSHYLPRAVDFSDDGETWRGAYGPRLRGWEGFDQTDNNHARLTTYVDQWQECIDLLRKDPTSRRAVMVIFDPARDFVSSKDIPCNNWLAFSNRLGRLDLQVGIRSNDLLWGWSGINAFEWSVLQEITAGMLGVEVGSLHFSINSLHIYDRHWDRAKSISGERFLFVPNSSPRFNPTGVDDLSSLDSMLDEWFEIEEIIRERSYPLADIVEMVDKFPEPMFQSWLWVLQWWWTGNYSYLKPLAGTRLEYATYVSIQPPSREPEPRTIEDRHDAIDDLQGSLLSDSDKGRTDPVKTEKIREAYSGRSDFINHLTALHDEKHAAYGDSWMKRGELFSIIPNIARKIDRLGESETADETSADTAGDLFVYLAKYRGWIFDQSAPGATRSADTRFANNLLAYVENEARHAPVSKMSTENLITLLKQNFEELGARAEKGQRSPDLVDEMLPRAYVLARRLWEEERLPIPRPKVIRDLLLMTDLPEIEVNEIKHRWSDHQKRRAVAWASAVHLSASDNDVEVPSRPAFLDKYEDSDKYRGADFD